jgi:nucleoside-diphosphate-sugar epimerase
MTKKIFVAGATGAIGSRLISLLRTSTYKTFGTTRDERKASWLRDEGAEPVVIDVFDRTALIEKVVSIEPDVVISQLTDLPKHLEAGLTDEALRRDARMRREGVANLIDAACQSRARRLVAQSYLPIYAPKPGPHLETDPLDEKGPRAITVAGVLAMESALLHAPPLEAVVLRCGDLYGPGTWHEFSGGEGFVHVDAAAWAALRAIDHGAPGIYNIADDDGYASIEKAARELAWSPDLRVDQSAATYFIRSPMN